MKFTKVIKGVFLDISKAFDKVWHEGLLFKLQSYRIEGSLLRLLKNYLTARQQRVVLNEQDDTSLFSKIENKSYSNFQLNKDLETISKWGFQWKILFNPDPIKQAIKLFFT